MKYKTKPLQVRFEKKFTPSESGCWEWTAQKCPKGYGRIKIDGVTCKAHRTSYELYVGPIENDLHVLHRCDNPSCVNPKHLFTGTNQDNMQDMARKGRGHFNREKFIVIGESNGRAILTEQQVSEITRDARKVKIIAEDYGVSIWAIYDIRAGRRWAHLQ